MRLNLADFFSPDRLFVSAPGAFAEPSLFSVLLWIGIGGAMLGFFGRILTYWLKIPNVKKRPWKILSEWVLSGSILFLLWLLLRRESVAILSSRFVIVLIALGYLIWLGWILFYLFVRYPATLRTHEELERKKKYLPQRKV